MKKINITESQLGMLTENAQSVDATEYLEANGIKTLYHATPSCYVDSIKKHGLGGKMPTKRFWDYKGTSYEGIENGCFLSSDEYVAESYLESSDDFYELFDAYKEEYGKELEIVVFAVDVSVLDKDLISFDDNQQLGEDGEPTFFYSGVIPYNVLKIVEL